MKKQNLLILLVSVLFITGITLSSCSKKDDTKPNDEQNDNNNNGDQNGDGDNNTDTTDNQNGDGDETDVSAYLQGSNYYLIALDATTEAKIDSKVKEDYRTDDVNNFLYIWAGAIGPTLEGATASGPNSFGEVEAWSSMSVINGQDWGGAGNWAKGPIDLSGLTDDYVFHVAMKSKADVDYYIEFTDGAENGGHTADFIFGSGSNAYANFDRDGEWHNIDIPVSDIFDKGIRYDNEFGLQDANADGIHGANIVAFIVKPAPDGTPLQYDGAFFYLPKK